MNLAIIIPYYKLIFFRETLDSLALQTDQRFHVYVGNDASPENPQELLKEFEGKFTFTYEEFEKNLGATSLTKQWERCMEMMQDEDWVMILGDDDFLSSNVVEEFHKNKALAEKESINVIKLNSIVIDESGGIILEKQKEPIIKSAIEHFFDKFIDEGRSSLSEHIFRKSQLKKHGFKNFPFAWHSDDFALLECSDYGNILFLEKAKCFVRISTKSISGNPDKNKMEKWKSTQLFFTAVCKNLTHFSKEQKRKLFDLIEWQEKDKNIRISIPNKLVEFYKAYGWKGILKSIL